MAPGAPELAPVPVEPEPVETIEGPVHRGLGRALAVGVFDAQQERAAEVFRVEPVEET